MFDPVQLRSFVTVAQTMSFTQAADRLGVRQSTVSQHVRKLEAVAGRPLFTRDTHTVALTPDGETMLEFARSILETTDRALAHFAGAQVHGKLRFGASDDLVLSRLPTILAAFRRRHPLVDLELTVGLSGSLHELVADDRLDLVFAKRPPGTTHGVPVWRDRYVWLGTADTPTLDAAEPVPLVCYPPPSLSRGQALAALARAGRTWRITCTSGGLNGLRAAVLAGLGVMPHAASIVPAGLVELPARHRLPELGEAVFVLTPGPRGLDGPATALSDAILAAGVALRTPSPQD